MTSIRSSAIAASAAVLLLLPTGPLLAAERTGWYVGGGIGGGTAEPVNSTPVTCNYYFGSYLCSDIDEDVLVLQIQGGYRVNPYFAVEGKIMGAANDSGDDYYDGYYYYEDYNDVSFGALSVRAVGLLPVSDLVDLYALAGLYTGESEVGYWDEDESGLVYGGGAQFNFGSRGQFGMRLEFEVYDTDELLDDVKSFTAAFQYNFF